MCVLLSTVSLAIAPSCQSLTNDLLLCALLHPDCPDPQAEGVHEAHGQDQSEPQHAHLQVRCIMIDS